MQASAATLLRLLRLASPALPVGGFSYSEGLESAVDSGRVGSEADAAAWLSAQLQLTLARAELPALALACTAWAQHDAAAVCAVDCWLRRTRETAELRAQSEQMAHALLQWLRNSADAADPRVATLAALDLPAQWPTAFALAATLAGATPAQALLTFCWSWAENAAQAAMKTVPLGQAAAQRLLQQLADAIPPAVDAVLALPKADRQAFAPMLAILSAQHETQYSRLFRS